MSDKIKLTHLEMHVTDSCNMKCRCCTHFCDFTYGGHIPYERGYEWMCLWAQRLQPDMFRLLGGEPFLTKDLEKYLHAAEELFPDSMRDVSTNGLLLTKREDILSIFIETGTTLVLSIHEVSTIEDEMAIISAIKLASRWVKKGLKFAIAESNENWRRFYRGEGGGIRRARFNIGILN